MDEANLVSASLAASGPVPSGQTGRRNASIPSDWPLHALSKNLWPLGRGKSVCTENGTTFPDRRHTVGCPAKRPDSESLGAFGTGQKLHQAPRKPSLVREHILAPRSEALKALKHIGYLVSICLVGYGA